jgi:hypothetical protein
MYWNKPGATLEALTKDKYNCLKESQQGVSHSENNLYGGKATSNVITNNTLFNACMNAQGWFLSPVDFSANKVVEEQPKIIQEEPVAQPAPQPVAQPIEKKPEPSVEPKNATTSSFPMVVAESKAKLRKNPSAKAAAIKTLKKGEEVQVIKEKDGWCLVELAGGETGWCLKSALVQKK